MNTNAALASQAHGMYCVFDLVLLMCVCACVCVCVCVCVKGGAGAHECVSFHVCALVLCPNFLLAWFGIQFKGEFDELVQIRP